MVEIREVVGEGREETRHRICRQRHNTQTPIVFHYASSVRIVYEWEQEQSSGFTLYFDFSSSEHGELFPSTLTSAAVSMVSCFPLL